MANPYYPYQSEANMMAALAENSAKLEEDAKQRRKAGNVSAALQRNKEAQSILQRREEEVASYLQEIGLEKIKTGADGNCFFYAVQGYGHIKGRMDISVSVLELRQAVAETIRTNRKYLDFFPKLRNSDPDPKIALQNHIKNIMICCEGGNKERNTWADEIDVAAFSDHFGVCIVIHDWHETTDFPFHMTKITYPDSCDMRQDKPIIHILRTNMNHYSLLMPRNDPQYQSVKLYMNDGIVSLPLDSEIVMAQRNSLRQMARNSAINLTRIHLNQRPIPSISSIPSISLHRNVKVAPTVVSSSSSVPAELKRYANSARQNLSSVKLASNQEYRQTLIEQIKELEDGIERQTIKRKTAMTNEQRTKIDVYLTKAIKQLEDRKKKLRGMSGGTRKRKHKMHHKRNKNKSRRRL